MPTSSESEIKIRPITLLDTDKFPEAVEILNRTQGRNLFEPSYLDKIVRNPNSYSVGAFKLEKIFGLGIVQIISDFSYYLPFDKNISLKLKGRKVGSFSTLAIHESLQGQGLGQKISQLRLEWVIQSRCDTVLGVSWVSGLTHTSDRVFEKMGFTYVKKVDNFYRESSLENPFDCPGCKKSPCACSAILYRKHLR